MPFSRAENQLMAEGRVFAQTEHQPGLLLVFLSWCRNFCAEFQGSSTPKMIHPGTGEITKPVQSGQGCETAPRSELCPGSACKAGRLPALHEHFAFWLPFSISKEQVLNKDLEEILKLSTKVALQKVEFITLTDHRHRWQNKEESHLKHSRHIQTVTAEK